MREDCRNSKLIKIAIISFLFLFGGLAIFRVYADLSYYVSAKKGIRVTHKDLRAYQLFVSESLSVLSKDILKWMIPVKVAFVGNISDNQKIKWKEIYKQISQYSGVPISYVENEGDANIRLIVTEDFYRSYSERKHFINAAFKLSDEDFDAFAKKSAESCGACTAFLPTDQSYIVSISIIKKEELEIKERETEAINRIAFQTFTNSSSSNALIPSIINNPPTSPNMTSTDIAFLEALYDKNVAYLEKKDSAIIKIAQIMMQIDQEKEVEK